MDEPLTEASARLAYKFILGRPAESEAMVQYALSLGSVRRLRDAFVNSLEFEPILHRRPRTVRPDAPPLAVAWQASDAAVSALLPVPRPAEAAQADPAAVRACLARNGLTYPGSGGVFDFAGAAATDLQFGMAAPFELWISFHRLQHCPPPLAARVLARALALLRPGGAAVFQLLTYGYGYGYDLSAPPPPAGDAVHDLHVLPQTAVFALLAQAGCTPLEVFDDLSVPPAALWRSSVFVVRKPE